MTRAEMILTDAKIKFDKCFMVDKNLLEKYYHGDPYYNINMEPYIYFVNEGKYFVYKMDEESTIEITKERFNTIRKDYDDAWEWYQTW